MWKNALKNAEYMLDLCVRMGYHSTAIEGNSLTQDQSASIILNQIIPNMVSEREFYEVRNYRLMLSDFIFNLLENRKISNELIKEFHRIIMKDLRDDAGSFKKSENAIIGADFDPIKVSQIPTALKNWTDNLYYKLGALGDVDSKTKAILELHIDFERIHPFSDGNGRIGRLLLVYSCFENNIAPIVFPSKDKSKYIAFLRSGDLDGFLEFAKELQKDEFNRMSRFV